MDGSISALVMQTAAAQGVDPNLALALARQESGLNQNVVSSAGAIGVMQLMPATAAQLAVDPTDVTQNIQGGITYLRQLLAQFGDPTAAVAAYNCGPGCVRALQSKYGANWLAYAPAETQNYVRSILGVTASLTPSPAPAASPFAPSTSVMTLVPAIPGGNVAPAFDFQTIGLALALILGVGYALSEG
jgi:soluble lytic murein transglycosylase-like protein